MPKFRRAGITDIFEMPQAARLVLFASALALAFALTMQLGLHFEPCILCLWQRAPFAIAILLSATALIPGLRPQASALLNLCSLAFLIGAGLAVFHTGVEQHWWLGTSGCAITPLKGASAGDLRQQLLHTVVARCDQVNWTFLKLSMANWNVLYSLSLAAFSFTAARR